MLFRACRLPRGALTFALTGARSFCARPVHALLDAQLTMHLICTRRGST